MARGALLSDLASKAWTAVFWSTCPEQEMGATTKASCGKFVWIANDQQTDATKTGRAIGGKVSIVFRCI